MPSPSSPTFSAAHLERFFEACNAHDIDGIAGFFTTDGLYLASIGPDDDGTSYRGLDGVRRGFRAFFDTYPDGHYTDIEVAVDGDRGYAKWTFTGTPASGPKMSYRGVDLFEFVGDRIQVKDAFRKERSSPIGA